MSRFIPIILLAAIAGVCAPEASAQLVRLKEHRFQQDGLQRNYLLYTPAKAKQLPGKRPLVLVLHGGGGTARGMVRLTNRGFHELADRDGFYVVYPDAVDKTWDFGEGKVSENLKRRVDDEAYFKHILDSLVREHPIDPQRIFATGISRGGQASYFLAAKFPGRIRAIAPVTMPIPEFLATECAKGPPIGLALINGTTDPLVPYGGGQIKVFGKERGAVLSTDATVLLFRKRNRCTSKAPARQTIDPVQDGTTAHLTAWRSAAGAPVVLYRLENAGHTWPSGTQYLPERTVGKVCRDIDGAEVIWNFFKTFP